MTNLISKCLLLVLCLIILSIAVHIALGYYSETLVSIAFICTLCGACLIIPSPFEK